MKFTSLIFTVLVLGEVVFGFEGEKGLSLETELAKTEIHIIHGKKKYLNNIL